MRPTQFIKTLTAILPTKQPTYIWGPPGIGKSDCVRQAAINLKWDIIDLRAVLLDPVDLRGLPTVSMNGDGKPHACWAIPAFLPHDKDSKGVLFLDELAQAPPMVQAAMLQLCLDRRVGEYVLPAGWTVIAASNRSEDRAGAHRLITPLLNRFIHLDLDVSLDDWRLWALDKNLSSEVVSFMAWKPDLLHKFDSSSHERAFPTPRSWAFVSNILPHTTEADLYDLVRGCVGDGPAAEFVAYTKIYRNLPDVDAIIHNPKKYKAPDDLSVQYALIGAITDRVKKITNANLLNNVATLAGFMTKDFAWLLMRDCYQVSQEIRKCKAARELLMKNKSFFFGDN